MRVVRLVHIASEVLRDLQFVCTAYGASTASYVCMLYRTVQRVYENFICTRADPVASRSYTYCKGCYGKLQFAYTSFSACMVSYVKML